MNVAHANKQLDKVNGTPSNKQQQQQEQRQKTNKHPALSESI
jgi:hypothetical protein